MNEIGTIISSQPTILDSSIQRGKNDSRILTLIQIQVINFLLNINKGLQINVEKYNMVMDLRILYLALPPGCGKTAIVAYLCKYKSDLLDYVIPTSNNGPVSTKFTKIRYTNTSIVIIPEGLLSHWKEEFNIAGTSYHVFTSKTGKLTNKIVFEQDAIIIPISKEDSNLKKYDEKKLVNKFIAKIFKYYGESKNVNEEMVNIGFKMLFVDESVTTHFKYQAQNNTIFNSMIIVNADGMSDKIMKSVGMGGTIYSDIERSLYDITKYVPNINSYIEIKYNERVIDYDREIINLPSNDNEIELLFKPDKLLTRLNESINKINTEIEFNDTQGIDSENIINECVTLVNSIEEITSIGNTISNRIIDYLINKQIIIVSNVFPSEVKKILDENNINYTTSTKMNENKHLFNAFENKEIQTVIVDKYEDIRGHDNMKNADGIIIFNKKNFITTEITQIEGRLLRLGRSNNNKPFIISFN